MNGSRKPLPAFLAPPPAVGGPDPTTTDPSTLPAQVTLPTAQGPTVFSPSPTQGEQSPRRREADTRSYAGPWSAVGIGLLVWSISFFNEIAALSWPELTTLKFVAGHVAQVLGVIAAIFGAKQIKS